MTREAVAGGTRRTQRKHRNAIIAVESVTNTSPCDTATSTGLLRPLAEGGPPSLARLSPPGTWPAPTTPVADGEELGRLGLGHVATEA